MADTLRELGALLDLWVIGGSGQIGAQDGRDEIVSARNNTWQAVVLDQNLSIPPGSPSVGDRYIIASGATGAWSGQDDNIAEWLGTSWFFFPAVEGMRTYVADENLVYEYTGSAWQLPAAAVSITTASATGTTTTTSATDVAAAGMSVNAPENGDYLAIFNGSVDHDTINAAMFTNIYANAVLRTESEREFRRGTAGGDVAASFACITSVFTLTAGQTVEGRWRTTVGTASMYERILMLIRVA